MDADRRNFNSWKRKNVTLRGIKNSTSEDNGVYGSFGKGLYTAFLSNRQMAKEYGKVYFVVNGIPKKPKTVQYRNMAEIEVQNLVDEFCKKNNVERSNKFFVENTTIEDEMLKKGYDGLVIKGREMVNYTPKDVLYFDTLENLYDYWDYNFN